MSPIQASAKSRARPGSTGTVANGSSRCGSTTASRPRHGSRWNSRSTSRRSEMDLHEMGPNEARARERMERDADIRRGLGEMTGTADMRFYADDLAYAALADAGVEYPDECPGC